MNAEQALKDWIKTQSLPVSSVEEHGFINGYNWALKNNEPVAWMDSLGNLTKQNLGDFIPLYTHPVNTCKHGVDDGACKECYLEVTHPSNPYQSITDTKIEPTVVSYTNPVELTDDVKDALMDALSGWKYIRQCHGDLYGVGWDRVQDKLESILRKAQEK